MKEKVNTGGNKVFVYTGKEKYKDTESTKKFKEKYRKHLSEPKGNIHREPIQIKANDLIVPIILALIIIGLSIKLTDGTLGSIDNQLSKIRGTLTPESIKERINIGITKFPNGNEDIKKEESILSEKIIKEEPISPIIDEETFERKDEAKQAFEYTINEFRREEGIDELEWSEHSYNLAIFRAKDLYERDYFEHVTPEGLSVSDYLEEFGLDGTVGENIGGMAHYPDETVSGSVREVIRQWMVSVGHKQNLLNKRYNLGAVGCYKYICTFIGVNGDEVTPIIETDEIVEEDSGEYLALSIKELAPNIKNYSGKKVEVRGKIKIIDHNMNIITGHIGIMDKSGIFSYMLVPKILNQIVQEGKTYTLKGTVKFKESDMFFPSFYYIEADQPLER